jgi:hypothetical protein
MTDRHLEKFFPQHFFHKQFFPEQLPAVRKELLWDELSRENLFGQELFREELSGKNRLGKNCSKWEWLVFDPLSRENKLIDLYKKITLYEFCKLRTQTFL